MNGSVHPFARAFVRASFLVVGLTIPLACSSGPVRAPSVAAGEPAPPAPVAVSETEVGSDADPATTMVSREAADPEDRPMAQALVIFGADTVWADVAATSAERARGLMDRTDLPPDGGMLFVFEQVEERTFWMKDTPLDLDVAFLDEDYRVFRIATMRANSTTLHDSGAPVFAALEVHGGWLAAHGVEVGDRARVVFLD